MKYKIFFLILNVFCRIIRHRKHRKNINNYIPQNPLIDELKRAQEIDEMLRIELSQPITDEALHNPNVPIYEPHKLTERQQDILLSY